MFQCSILALRQIRPLLRQLPKLTEMVSVLKDKKEMSGKVTNHEKQVHAYIKNIKVSLVINFYLRQLT